MLGCDDQASSPLGDSLRCEQQGHTGSEGFPPRLCETHQQQSGVRPGREPANIGEIQILCDQKAVSHLCRSPDFVVVTSRQVLRRHCVDVMPKCLEFEDQALGQILVKLDVHRMGDSATGRSS